MFAQRIPERRVTLLVAVADQFSNHRFGKAPRVSGDEQQARTGQQFGERRTHQFGIDVKTTQQCVAAEVMAQRQRRHAMFNVQFAGCTGEMAVAQAVERLVEARRRENLRAADQPLAVQVFQHEEVVLRALGCRFAVKRGAGAGDFLAQAFAVVRQGSYAHQTVAGQLL
ncbi:hypothetical protein D3C81_1635930 [compost metagenome]